MSTQSKAGPLGSSLSRQVYPNTSGPPLPSTPGRGSTSSLPSSIGWYASTVTPAVSRVPATKLRLLPPVLCTVSVRVAASGMLRVAAIDVGLVLTSGGTTALPERAMVLYGVSGSLLSIVKVAGYEATDPGLNAANNAALPSGGTVKLVWSTP